MKRRKSELPPGVTTIKPAKRSIGGFIPMVYDAKVECCGIMWYRIRDGMGAPTRTEKDASDWVADLPRSCLAIHRYNWTKQNFGTNYGSFEKACAALILRHHGRAEQEIEKLTRKLAEYFEERDLINRVIVAHKLK